MLTGLVMTALWILLLMCIAVKEYDDSKGPEPKIMIKGKPVIYSMDIFKIIDTEYVSAYSASGIAKAIGKLLKSNAAFSFAFDRDENWKFVIGYDYSQKEIVNEIRSFQCAMRENEENIDYNKMEAEEILFQAWCQMGWSVRYRQHLKRFLKDLVINKEISLDKYQEIMRKM